MMKCRYFLFIFMIVFSQEITLSAAVPLLRKVGSMDELITCAPGTRLTYKAINNKVDSTHLEALILSVVSPKEIKTTHYSSGLFTHPSTEKQFLGIVFELIGLPDGANIRITHSESMLTFELKSEEFPSDADNLLVEAIFSCKTKIKSYLAGKHKESGGSFVRYSCPIPEGFELSGEDLIIDLKDDLPQFKDKKFFIGSIPLKKIDTAAAAGAGASASS